MTRAATDIRQVEADITDCMRVIRECMKPVDDTREDYALCALECFVDIALRLMKVTNPMAADNASAVRVKLLARRKRK